MKEKLLNEYNSMSASHLEFDATSIGWQEKVLPIVWQQLGNFAKDADFASKMRLLFGEEIDVTALRKDWLAKDFSIIPEIKIREAAEINGASGAYAIETNTIYLSKELLEQNVKAPEAIASVLSEEIGHAIDRQLNTKDSEGDEGAIFSELVRENQLSDKALTELKAENDWVSVIVDGEVTRLELEDAAPPVMYEGLISVQAEYVLIARDGLYDPFAYDLSDTIVDKATIPFKWEDLNEDGELSTDEAFEAYISSLGSYDAEAELSNSEDTRTIEFKIVGTADLFKNGGSFSTQGTAEIGDTDEEYAFVNGGGYVSPGDHYTSDPVFRYAFVAGEGDFSITSSIDGSLDWELYTLLPDGRESFEENGRISFDDEGDTQTYKIEEANVYILSAETLSFGTNLPSGNFSGDGILTDNVSGGFSWSFEPYKEQVDLEIKQTDSKDPINFGEDLIYSLTVTNKGSSKATEVVLSNTLPEEVVLISASDEYDSNGNFLEFELGTLEAGNSATVDITVQLEPTLENQPAIENYPTNEWILTNTAEVTLKEEDINIDNNTSDETTQVITNSDPIAIDDSAFVTEGQQVTIDVLANDSDLDGDEIAIKRIVTNANHGEAVIQGNQILYSLQVAPAEVQDSFVYEIEDEKGSTDTATVTVDINSVPTAISDFASTVQGQEVAIDVLANDESPDGDLITIDNITDPKNGTIVNNNNQIVYTPNASFIGQDNFNYTITDGRGGKDTASVNIEVLRATQSTFAFDPNVIDGKEGQTEQIRVTRNGENLLQQESVDIEAITASEAVDFLSSLLSDFLTFTGAKNVVKDAVVDVIDKILDDIGAPFGNTPTTATKVFNLIGKFLIPLNIVQGAINQALATNSDISLPKTTVTFSPQITEESASIQLLDNSEFEGDRLFFLKLSQDGVELDSLRAAVAIRDDDQTEIVNITSDDARSITIDAIAAAILVGVKAFVSGGVVGGFTGVGVGAFAGAALSYISAATQDILQRTIVDYAVGKGSLSPLFNNDPVIGTEESETIDGDEGNNEISGNGGFDLLNGNNGDDTIFGGAGRDILDGGSGFDLLEGGSGADILSGSEGVDTFAGTLAELDGDVILDFTEEDVLQVEDANFTSDNITITQGSAILDIDADLDGAIDATITLEGDFTDKDFIVEPVSLLDYSTTFISINNSSSVNDPPIAENDEVATYQGEAVNINVLVNDSDLNEDVLSINTFDDTSTEGGSISLDDNGTPDNESDDRLIYTPAEDFSGSDNFTYTVSDGTDTATATVEVTVNPVDSSSNEINGTSGRDVLTGSDKDEKLIGLQSRDTLTGNGGEDRFVYTSIIDAGDVITDFEVGVDRIVLADVLDRFDYLGSDAIADGYVQFSARGSDSFVQLDPDGFAGSGRSRAFILVQNVAVDDLNDADNFVLS